MSKTSAGRKLKMNRETLKVLSRDALTAVVAAKDSPIRSAICSGGCTD